MEITQYEAQDRGTYRPKLKFDDEDDKITFITPIPFEQQPQELGYYDMSALRHGVALIINNIHYSRLKDRGGAERNDYNFLQTCLFLGYRPIILRDLKTSDILQLFSGLDKFLKDSDDKAEVEVAHDSLICYISSHGQEGTIICTDEDKVLIEDIEKLAGESKLLRSKPKVFFMDCSRGKRHQPDIQISTVQPERVTSERADIYFCFATALGYQSYRDIYTGSFFTTEVCKILCEYGPCYSLHSDFQPRLVDKVANNPNYRFDKDGEKFMQLPTCSNQLRKHVHFFDQTYADANQGQQHKIAYEKVIREKSPVEITLAKFNNHGFPRSGKTSFWRRMMGEIMNILMARKMGEKEQPSTGVAEVGDQIFIRRILTKIGTISSKEWSVINDYEGEASMIYQIIHEIVYGDDNSVAVPSASLSLPASVTDKMNNEETDSDVLKPVDFKETALALQKDSVNIEETFPVLHEAIKAEDLDKIKLLLEDAVLLINIDAGGHAEFLDLHATLVQGPSFNLVFSKLTDNLDNLYKIYYTNEKGESTEEEDSTMTTEEVLFQTLSSIACFGGSSAKDNDTSNQRNFKSKVMFVGTHRDMVSEEEFKEKDELLQKRIKRTAFHNFVEYAREGQMMLAVDNLKGGQDEIDEIRKVLENVIARSFKKVTIPVAWFVLSLLLRKSRTMSLIDCEQLAAKLNISPEELQHALWFLHHQMGVLLYYPEVKALKGTVICHIQIVFDSTTNLIKNTFKFGKVTQAMIDKFRDKAQFSLEELKEATQGHTDNLIPLEKLVELLEYLSILTPIPPPEGQSTQEPTYFMPCVLKSARSTDLNVIRSHSDPPSLMIRFDCGYTPVGVFPSIITNLVSQERTGWKMIEEGLRKNRVQFFVGKNFDKVTLISHPRYFEVIVSQNESFQTPVKSLCAYVRDVFQSTLDTVTKCMNYTLSMGYKYAFECPEHPGKEHLCVLDDASARCMQCLQNPKLIKPIPLQQHHLKWFSASTVQKVVAISMRKLNILKWRDDNGRKETFRLIEEISTEWKNIGLILGLKTNLLDEFEEQHHGNVKTCWTKVMECWLNGDGGDFEDEYPATWEGLYTLLDDAQRSTVSGQLKEAVARAYC